MKINTPPVSIARKEDGIAIEGRNSPPAARIAARGASRLVIGVLKRSRLALATNLQRISRVEFTLWATGSARRQAVCACSIEEVIWKSVTRIWTDMHALRETPVSASAVDARGRSGIATSIQHGLSERSSQGSQRSFSWMKLGRCFAAVYFPRFDSRAWVRFLGLPSLVETTSLNWQSDGKSWLISWFSRCIMLACRRQKQIFLVRS